MRNITSWIFKVLSDFILNALYFVFPWHNNKIMGHPGMSRITTNDLKWKILPLFHCPFCCGKETAFKMSSFLSISCCYCPTTGIRGENLLRYSSVQPVHFTDAFFCLNAWRMVRALVSPRQCCLSLFLLATASFPNWSKRRPGGQEKGRGDIYCSPTRI